MLLERNALILRKRNFKKLTYFRFEMKKILIAALAIMAMGGQMANAQVNTKASEDSLSRQYGKMMGESFKANPSMNLNKAEFIKGLNMMMAIDTTNASYLNGIEFGMSLLQQVRKAKESDNLTLNKDLFAQEMIKALNDTAKLSREQLMTMSNQLGADIKRVSAMTKANDPVALKNKKAGKAYVDSLLKADKKFVKTASGLLYKETAKGTGANFKESDEVRMKYRGMHVDGSVFDQANDTIELRPGQMIPGFKEAMLLMKPGSKMRVVIPSELAYGLNGAGGAIKANETLVFDIETYGLAPEKKEDKEAPKK